jgi:hypothetical protein
LYYIFVSTEGERVATQPLPSTTGIRGAATEGVPYYLCPDDHGERVRVPVANPLAASARLQFDGVGFLGAS